MRKWKLALAASVVLVATAASPGHALAGTRHLVWGSCPDGGGVIGMECTTIQVPVNWAKPTGRRITLMLGRLRADGPKPAKGTVLANFGAGAPGIKFLRDMVDPAAFANLRHDMDIVTWDPRGYTNGYSTPLPCAITSTMDPGLPADQAEFDRIAARNRAVAQTCRDRDRAFFDSVGTVHHARDMDAIRRALGEHRLNLYMGSYGGAFGQAYARLFPHRIRTMVLDSVGNMADLQREDVARARDGEERMQRFIDWCTANSSCALHGRDVARVWQDLIARADRSPVPHGDQYYDGVALQNRTVAYLMMGAGATGWTRFAEAIVAAGHDDLSGFANTPQPAAPSPDIIACQDFPRHANHAAMTTTINHLRQIAPNTGASATSAVRLGCLGYPTPVTFPTNPVSASVPPVLGVGAWDDFPGTNRAVQRIAGSMTIYHDGPGHELYASNNACVIALADRYFVTLELPPAGTVCP